MLLYFVINFLSVLFKLDMQDFMDTLLMNKFQMKRTCSTTRGQRKYIIKFLDLKGSENIMFTMWTNTEILMCCMSVSRNVDPSMKESYKTLCELHETESKCGLNFR